MTTLPDWLNPAPEALLARVKTTRSRLGMTPEAMAAYMGVTIYTYRKWENGTRVPGAAVTRLLDVLEIVETHPDLHSRVVAL